MELGAVREGGKESLIPIIDEWSREDISDKK